MYVPKDMGGMPELLVGNSEITGPSPTPCLPAQHAARLGRTPLHGLLPPVHWHFTRARVRCDRLRGFEMRKLFGTAADGSSSASDVDKTRNALPAFIAFLQQLENDGICELLHDEVPARFEGTATSRELVQAELSSELNLTVRGP